jgi:hypothetical protein
MPKDVNRLKIVDNETQPSYATGHEAEEPELILGQRRLSDSGGWLIADAGRRQAALKGLVGRRR